MPFETWIKFLAFAFLITIMPGPGSIFTVNHALQHGFKRTLIVINGQELAIFITMFIVATASRSISENIIFMLSIKICGFIWLIYSAWSIWNSPSNNLPLDSIPKSSKLSRFMRGFFVDITNSKAITVLLLVVPGYIDVKYSMWTQAVILSMTLVMADTIMLLTYSSIAGRLRLSFNSPCFVRRQNQVSAIVLLLIAVRVIM